MLIHQIVIHIFAIGKTREEFEKKTLCKDCLKEKTHFFDHVRVFSVSFDPNQIQTSQLELWYEEVREVESAICYDVNEIHCKCLQEISYSSMPICILFQHCLELKGNAVKVFFS